MPFSKLINMSLVVTIMVGYVPKSPSEGCLLFILVAKSNHSIKIIVAQNDA